MANSTDKSILTAAGKALLAQLNAEEKALVIDKMIFANVPNRPEYPQPDDVVPTDHIVHQEQVEQRGRLSADSVIYSSTLTSDVGPFDFNWTGAYCSEYGVLVTIDHHALTPKTADEPGVAGNTLVRSVVLEYKDIAEITNITVDASSWQYNATERMKKMDSDVAQSIIDQNGKDWFLEDGFLVTPSGSAYSIKAGAGYVSGNRVAMEFDRSVQVPNKPSFIYIDAHREGTPTGEQVTLFNFVVTAEEKDDYIDSSTGKDVKHFVCKIAQVLEGGGVICLRINKKINRTEKIVFYAHRGGMRGGCENTIYAFSKALETGADGLEADIAVSADGTPYIYHDKDVSILTNGAGSFNDLSDAQIESLRFKKLIGTKMENLVRIPTVSEFLAFLERKGCLATLEIKLPRIGKEQEDKERVLRLLSLSPISSKITIQTTNMDDVKRVRNFSRDLNIAFSYASFVHYQDELRAFRANGVKSLQISSDNFELDRFKEMLVMANNLGFTLTGYTSNNNESELMKIVEQGFDSVISDRGWEK
ncbi:TPA: glycerophosphodiester phosphodiesterase family protein [Vibrio parahaemolyticus]|nr:phage tail protein [Vibrio parahaemolyticus]